LVEAIASQPGRKQRDIASGLRAQGFTFSGIALGAAWAEVRGAGAGKHSKRASYKRGSKAQPLCEIEEDVPLADPVSISEPDDKPLYGGILPAPDVHRRKLDGRRFFFTAAQNNTMLHDDWWASVQQFCRVNNVQLGVSRISYNKSGWQKVTTESEGLWYDPRIEPYVLDEQVKIADDLVFCGELDVLATAVNPLSGLDNYTGPNSAIIPHTKQAMQSLATMKNEPAKFLYTTGTSTLRNYIDRKAGQVASYHHIYGGLYVEIDDEGEWFARQINAEDDGTFYDLDRVYGPGWDKPADIMGRPMVNLGDIHIEKMDAKQLSGAMDMLATLNPKGVFLHDLLDFEARNHHNKQDPLFLHEQHFQRSPSVEFGIMQAARFLAHLQERFPKTVLYVIRSNHDEAFKRWMREGTKYPDPVNMRYWHEVNAAYLRAVEERSNSFDVYQWAIKQAAAKLGADLDLVQFIQEDQSLVLNGIEYGLHGHLGLNGARATPRSYRQIGRKANTGHTHSAGIIEGIFTSGVLGSLDMGYNKGPSSWSCSHIITYPNAKRTIVTQRKHKWRA
jgi:hypothetical protein